jgi:hypothetical protein
LIRPEREDDADDGTRPCAYSTACRIGNATLPVTFTVERSR